MTEARRREGAVAVLLGLYAAAIAVAPNLNARLFLCIPLLALPLAWWAAASPNRWVMLLLGSTLVLPPLPIALGDSGPHVAIAVAAIGLVAGLMRSAEWKLPAGAFCSGPVVYFFAVLASVAFAAVYSGPVIAAASLARALLFGIAVYVFLYAAYGPRMKNGRTDHRLLHVLCYAWLVGGVFACVDFYFQFPAPAGFAAQYVWLDSGVYRRAQGVFYEASTLGNLSVFFLIMAAVFLVKRRESEEARTLSRPLLLAIAVVSVAALMLSFSRASLAALFAGLAALLVLHWERFRLSRAAVMCLVLAGGVVVSALAFPQFADFYWLRLSSPFTYFAGNLELMLSGRVESWTTLGSFILQNPWHAIFGVGYKTLPYSGFLGRPIVADNAYLSALVETGIIGLGALLWLNVFVLRHALRAARQPSPWTSLLGTWLFCFWVAEALQMMSGDLLTYWRVLPLYFCLLGLAVRHSGRPHERPLPGPVQ